MHGWLGMGPEQGLLQASGLQRSGGVLEKGGGAFVSFGECWQQQGTLLMFSDDISISPSSFYLINMISLTRRDLS